MRNIKQTEYQKAIQARLEYEKRYLLENFLGIPIWKAKSNIDENDLFSTRREFLQNDEDMSEILGLLKSGEDIPTDIILRLCTVKEKREKLEEKC